MSRLRHAWITHAAEDYHVAAQLAGVLKRQRLRIGVDGTGRHTGTLLSRERRAAIGQSRVLVLLWSAAASQSRAVNVAWLAAFYEDRFIVPCVLDVTPLPPCLQTTVYLDLRRSSPHHSERLISAVRGAPNAANPIVHVVPHPPTALLRPLKPMMCMQQDICACWYRRDRDGMATLQRQLDGLITKYRLLATPDPSLASFQGYHFMHTYILKYWEAIQDRHPPADVLLDEAEQSFLNVLAMTPADPPTISTLGHVLLLQRDSEAAAFFMRTALAYAQQNDLTYPAVHVDRATLAELEGQL
ncbi:MAG: hypothetical protein ETSY1_47045 (plasmid) [Candidatus Entotheonella factor]|uniref:TIR domain-containing protein n=1 Tax=Entotheonella factor TaxID=1429438 RepID=W4M1E8_ENTF1|nr:MAG: hypothetical protein ETSY1_47045 [Candidatus Entotheonella factor]